MPIQSESLAFDRERRREPLGRRKIQDTAPIRAFPGDAGLIGYPATGLGRRPFLVEVPHAIGMIQMTQPVGVPWIEVIIGERIKRQISSHEFNIDSNLPRKGDRDEQKVFRMTEVKSEQARRSREAKPAGVLFELHFASRASEVLGQYAPKRAAYS